MCVCMCIYEIPWAEELDGDHGRKESGMTAAQEQTATYINNILCIFWLSYCHKGCDAKK